MATTQQETPIGDDELDALMAELETETADMVAQPAPAAAAPATEVPDDQAIAEMDALEAELAEPAPVAAAPAPAPEPEPVIEQNSVEDEMAALEAELNGTAAKPAPAPMAAKPALVAKAAPAPAPEPKPEPVPEPAPAPEPAPKPALKAVPPRAAPDDEGEPVAAPNPIPKAAPAALQFFIDVAQFRDETKVAEHNLDNCMMQQAGLRAYYAEQAARAEAQHDRLKARFKVLEAQLYDQHRKALVAAGEKATEKMVENAVLSDPKWLKNSNVVIEAQTIANINRGLVDSLKDRKDMLVQLGADRREEGKGQLRVMAQTQAHDDVKARATAAARSA